MKRIGLTAAVMALMAATVHAETIGVSISKFDDNFLTVLREGMTKYAVGLDGVTLQIEDAQGDMSRQLSQVQNFIASGADAIIVNAVDTDATIAMSEAASKAGVPLVYVNYEPANVDNLPDKQAFVASNEVESGTLQTQDTCRQLKEMGKGDGAKVLVIMGELQHQAARIRTKDIKDVIATDGCKFMSIVEEQSANWQRTQAVDLMANWLSAGVEFDAVIANNDEMAIGAIQAMKAVGIDKSKVVVAGIDATADALAAMEAGDLDVTVFQNAAAQGQGSVDAALKLRRGETVEKKVYVPFELVTHANITQYKGAN
ncbi:sugar ABC transporter substrate-binding protein [Pararhizobium sp. A13]|uniref:sugar ABC transporter substrate-binding protein n=1 Tax=Pararhizobium sp. A13 TaxID=3133975 RepID=UPI00324B2FB3